MHKVYSSLLDSLKTHSKKDLSVAVGFDGFIDSIVKPVLSTTENTGKYFPTISSFGEYLCSKASLSCSIELDVLLEKAGGNMPIYASALSASGISCDLIGSLGYPEVHETFSNFAENINVTSVADYGKCLALEFEDGKVMLSESGGTTSVDFPLLIKNVGKPGLIKWLENSDAFALLNWSELPGMMSVWRGLLDEVLPSVTFDRLKLMLVDISDCSRRSESDIVDMLKMITEFGKFINVVFSLNLNESQLVCKALGKVGDSPIDAGVYIYETLNPHLLVLHLLDGALIYENSNPVYIPNYRIESPKTSTGGGDNFNAGLIAGLLMDFSCDESVAMANAMSSFYVENSRSASIDEVIEYIKSHHLKI